MLRSSFDPCAKRVNPYSHHRKTTRCAQCHLVTGVLYLTEEHSRVVVRQTKLRRYQRGIDIGSGYAAIAVVCGCNDMGPRTANVVIYGGTKRHKAEVHPEGAEPDLIINIQVCITAALLPFVVIEKLAGLVNLHSK